jgi:hypothetical protein
MEHLADKAMKAMFSLQATLKQLGHPPIPVILQLYESMLKPVMCYGSEVWGFNENKNLERVELRFLKYILHLPLSAPNMAVRGELGQLPLHLWWIERILKFWDRLCAEDAPMLLKAAVHCSLDMAYAGKRCWAHNVISFFRFLLCCIWL